MTNDIQQSLPWLQSSWAQLVQYINQNRVPQALLITGQKGLGKQALAEHFAHSLLCTVAQSKGAYCSQCQSCLLFKAETHPDYMMIKPEEVGKAIGVSVIRQLTTTLSLKPQFEGYRVVVVNPADSLNNAAANAFLKYLEEPTERTCLVLVTDRPSKLSATILSRCQKMVLSKPDSVVLTEWLKRQGILDNHDLLLNLSNGTPLLAKQLADSDLLQLRLECFNNWLNCIDLDVNFIELAGQWHRLEKTKVDFLLFWMVSWAVDLIKLAFHQQPIKLFNPDLIINLQELTQKLDSKNLFKYYDFLLLTQQRFDTQLNKQLMFEEILIRWLKLNNR